MRTGAEYRQALYNGRRIWVIGDGLVEDVTVHRSALLQMAWDHVSSALDGRESAFDLHANGGMPAWRGRLRCSHDRRNELANAVLDQLKVAIAEIDLDAVRAAPLAPRRVVAPSR